MEKFEDLCKDFKGALAYSDLVKALPKELLVALSGFKTDDELEIATNVLLTCISGILVDVLGKYNGAIVHPMLYTAVVANAASNKGIIDYGNDLLGELDQHFREQSRLDRKLYIQQLSAWKKAGGGTPKPDKPPYKVVTLSANITSAKLMEQLSDNQGDAPSIIIADEIDTISEVDRGDFGGLSHMLRSAYHHAKISQQLKGDNQDYIVRTPKLALLIGGTPEQMLRLIGSAENGLYSRFCVIPIDGDGGWNDVSPNSGNNHQATFQALAPMMLDMFHWFRNHPLTVVMNTEQWGLLNEFGTVNLGRVTSLKSNQLSSVVKRHGLICFKVAMVLTAVRSYLCRDTSATVECKDVDFKTALMLTMKSLRGSEQFFPKLHGSKPSKGVKDKLAVLDSLANEFSRREFIEKAKKMKIPERTADRYLQQLLNGKIVLKLSHGAYSKAPLAKLAKWQDNEESSL